MSTPKNVVMPDIDIKMHFDVRGTIQSLVHEIYDRANFPSIVTNASRHTAKPAPSLAISYGVPENYKPREKFIGDTNKSVEHLEHNLSVTGLNIIGSPYITMLTKQDGFNTIREVEEENVRSASLKDQFITLVQIKTDNLRDGSRIAFDTAPALPNMSSYAVKGGYERVTGEEKLRTLFVDAVISRVPPNLIEEVAQKAGFTREVSSADNSVRIFEKPTPSVIA